MKKPTKKQALKQDEDRIAANTEAAYSEVKDIASSLALLGFVSVADRMLRANHALLVARADFARIRRTRPTPEKNPDLKRLRSIETAAQEWTAAITARRRANARHGHPDFKRYMARIVSAGKNLRSMLGE